MTKLFLILALALSANAWAGEEFTLVCNLDESESEMNKQNGVVPDGIWDILQVHVEGEKRKRFGVKSKGYIISETLTDGKVVNLKVLIAGKESIFFQTRRPIAFSNIGTVDRITGAIDIQGSIRDGIDYSGLCEIVEE